MGRHKKDNNTKYINCLNCNNIFEIPKHKNRTFCSVKCSQIYTKSKNKNWLKNRDITNLNKYGVKSPFESELVKDKYKKNLLNKYGKDNPFKIKEFKDKSNKTIKERYGNEYASQNKDISKKISNSLIGRIISKNNFIEIKWEKIENYCKLTKLTPLFDKENLNIKISDPNVKFEFQCNICKIKTEVCLRNGYLPTCWKCSNYKGYSIIEDEIISFLKENYINDIEIKNRKLLSSNREIDIFLPNLNLAIEINGIYWHSEKMGKYKNYHLSKTEECLKQNIQLIHIFDYEWINKKEIIKSILLNKVKLTPTKIYARKCQIKEVSSKEKNDFLNLNHIQGQCVSKNNIGLFYNNELVSIMTFGINRFSKNKEIELIRFCNKLNTTVVGGASRLFQYFIKNYNPIKITSFADRRFSNGNMYKQLGMKISNYTSPSYYYFKGYNLYNRMNFQKHKLQKIFENFDINLSEYQNMLNNGYNRIWDCGNYKFEWKKEENHF